MAEQKRRKNIKKRKLKNKKILKSTFVTPESSAPQGDNFSEESSDTSSSTEENIARTDSPETTFFTPADSSPDGKPQVEPSETKKKLGKYGEIVYKVLTGNAFIRIMGAITILAGATLATIPTVVIGLTAIIVGAVIDTVQTVNLRYQKQEYKRLLRHRYQKEKQDAILQANPELANALEGLLYQPIRDGQKSLTERYKISDNNPGSWGKAIIKNLLNIVKTVGTAIITGNIVAAAASIAMAITSIYREGKEQVGRQKLHNKFKTRINNERENPNNPGYNHIDELAYATRAQKVQSKALKALVRSESYNPNGSHEEIRGLFEQCKLAAENKVKPVNPQKGAWNQTRYGLKAFGKVHNPFSPYADLEQLDKNNFQTPDKKKRETETQIPSVVGKTGLTQYDASSKKIIHEPKKYSSALLKELNEVQKTKNSGEVKGKNTNAAKSQEVTETGNKSPGVTPPKKSGHGPKGGVEINK